MNARPQCSRFIALFLLLNCCRAEAAPPPDLLIDGVDRANVSKYLTTDCQVQLAQTGSGPALELAFGHEAPWPHVRFLPDRFGYSTDWSASAFVAVTVSNPTAVPVTVNVRVDSESLKDRGR